MNHSEKNLSLIAAGLEGSGGLDTEREEDLIRQGWLPFEEKTSFDLGIRDLVRKHGDLALLQGHVNANQANDERRARAFRSLTADITEAVKFTDRWHMKEWCDPTSPLRKYRGRP